MRVMRSAWLLAVLCWPAAASAADCNSLDALRWLAGDWVAHGEDSSFHESWAESAPRTLEGTGIERASADGSVRGTEELRLVQMGDGVFYIAKVAHNALPVAFRLTSCSDGRYVFENPAHDFPRRVEYRHTGEAGLTVQVSDGADRGFTLEFGRTESSLLAGAQVLLAEDARFAAMIAAREADMGRWLDSELEYVHSNGTVEGRDRLLASIAAGRIRYLSAVPVERYVYPLARDVALVHGLGDFRVAAGGDPMDLRLHYTAVYLLREGTWRLRSWQSLRVP